MSAFTGWASVEVFDYTNVGALSGVLFQSLLRPSLNVVGNTIYLSAEAAPVFDGDARYFLGTITIEPLRLQLRGVKRYVRTGRKQTCATKSK